MARPRAFDPEETLTKATEVFWTKGYRGASVQDLVDATGLKRGSLYNAYGDKRGLFAAALTHYLASGPARTVLMAAQQTPPLADPLHPIGSFFTSVLALTQRHDDLRGCLLVNAIAEMAGEDPDLRSAAQQTLGGLEDALTVLLTQAESQNQTLSPRSPRAQARFLVSLFQGLLISAKSGADKDTLFDITAVGLAALSPAFSDFALPGE